MHTTTKAHARTQSNYTHTHIYISRHTIKHTSTKATQQHKVNTITNTQTQIYPAQQHISPHALHGEGPK